jgi:formylglycine-generating enzyme required for sulfatase activity
MRNKLAITLGVTITLLASGQLCAQGLDEVSQTDAGTVTERLLERAGFRNFQKSFALVVGVSDFDNFNDLPTAQDPIRVRDFLINEAGFDYVHLLTGDKVTKERLEELMLDDFRTRVGDTDRFLFYWSGHGETLEGAQSTRGFLPLQASKKNQFSSMVSMEDIGDWDSYLNAHQVLYLLDSCFSGLVGAAPQSDLADITRAQLSGPSRHVITAGRGDEQTIAIDQLGGSVFTNALLSGLRGAADAENAMGKDNIVSLGELKNYLGPRVAKLSSDHGWQKTITPQIRDLVGSDGAFFFPISTAFPTGPTAPLKPEESRITEVQDALRTLGYDPGPLDGNLSFKTVAALLSFQQQMGLQPTGEIDAATLAAFPHALMKHARPMGGTDTPEIDPDQVQPQGGNVEPTPVPETTLVPCQNCPDLVQVPVGDNINLEKDFYISTTEVTVAQFEHYASETGLNFVDAKTNWGPSCFAWQDSSKLRKTALAFNQPFEDLDPDLPVSCVSRNDAQGYIDWLNESNDGPKYRLPTSIEFVFLLKDQMNRVEAANPELSANRAALACKLGNFGDGSTNFPWRNSFCSDGQSELAKVASFDPDAHGIYDLAGNLWEWSQDCVQYEQSESQISRVCVKGALKGGSFDDPVENIGAEVKQSAPADRRQTNIGFRIARDIN